MQCVYIYIPTYLHALYAHMHIFCTHTHTKCVCVHTYMSLCACAYMYDAYSEDELTLTHYSSIIQLTACWLQAVRTLTQFLLCSCTCHFSHDSRSHCTIELLSSEVDGTYRKGNSKHTVHRWKDVHTYLS